MKLTSATAGVRRGMTAVSGERILLLCPGAPGCTMGALPGAGVSDWPQAVTTPTKSTTTEVTQTQCLIELEARLRSSEHERAAKQPVVSGYPHNTSNRFTAIEAARSRRLQLRGRFSQGPHQRCPTGRFGFGLIIRAGAAGPRLLTLFRFRNGLSGRLPLMKSILTGLLGSRYCTRPRASAIMRS